MKLPSSPSSFDRLLPIGQSAICTRPLPSAIYVPRDSTEEDNTEKDEVPVGVPYVRIYTHTRNGRGVSVEKRRRLSKLILFFLREIKT